MEINSLSVVIPQNIAILIEQGWFNQAKELIHGLMDQTIDQSLKDRLDLALLQMDTLIDDYPLNKQQAFEKCKVIDGFTMEEMDALIDSKYIDQRIIEGKACYRNNIVSGIVKCAFGYASRCPSVVMDYDPTSMVETMINDGYDYRRFVISQWVDLRQIKEPVSIWFPLPLIQDGQTNVAIDYASLPILSTGNGLKANAHAFIQADPLKNAMVKLTYSLEVKRSYGLTNESGSYTDLDLEEQYPQIVYKPELVQLVQSLVNGIESTMVKTRIIYDYITTHFTYAFQPSYLTIDDLLDKMVKTGKGDCGMYALMMVTMCRIAGIPARFESGLYANPDGLTIHDWMAYYIEGKGWIHCDPQMGSDGYIHGRTMEHQFYYDHIDAYHIIYNHGFMLPFHPLTPHLRFDPYDNQLPEIQGKYGSYSSTVVPRGFTIDRIEKLNK